MATFTDNKNQVKSGFLILKSLFDELSKFQKFGKTFDGNGDDFKIAIECGANSVSKE